MTPFQQYSHLRWTRDFAKWLHFREDLKSDVEKGHVDIRYVIPSPANDTNTLCVLFTNDDISVKFAVPGSHEHYDPDLYMWDDKEGSESDAWDQAYCDALNEYIYPVLQDKLFAVWYDNGAELVPDVEVFTTMNNIHMYQYESWSHSLIDYPPATVG